MINTSTHHDLILEDLRIPVRIGCLPEERSAPQIIIVNLHISFLETPKACTSDNIEDAICYADLAKQIQNYCDGKSFNLIEALGFQLYQFLKKYLSITTNISLSVTKNPPIPNLQNCTFHIGD